MFTKLKKKQEGFTIIEVMIVLVIAAVILLIVFLAVPALQRNSRNTQKKNIAADILSAASEHSSNKNGAIPAASVSTTANSDAATILGLVNTNGVITTLTVQAQGGAANPTLSTVVLETNARCNTAANAVAGSTVAGTSTRQIALRYQVEGGGGTGTGACIESGL